MSSSRTLAERTNVSYVSRSMGGTSLRALTFTYVTSRTKQGIITRKTAALEDYVLRGLCQVAGNRAPRQLGRKDIQRWLEKNQHLAASTREAQWGTIRRFLDWLVEEKHLARNPMRKMAGPKATKRAKRALGGQDAANILSACPDQRARLMVVLGLQVGLRRGEIAGLRTENVDFQRQAVTVTGKGAHERVVPIPEEAMGELKAYLAQEPATSGPLIRSYKTGRGISPARVGQVVTQACIDAGIKHRPYDGVSTHALRHTAATDVFVESRDLRAVQAMLGHSSLHTTDRYVAGLDLTALREAMAGRRYDVAS